MIVCTVFEQTNDGNGIAAEVVLTHCFGVCLKLSS